jgi:hypothetical protein
VNPAIHKDHTTFSFQPNACLSDDDCTAARALVLALDNVDPIPDDHVLFTCDFIIHADASPGSYEIAASTVQGSDPHGNRLRAAPRGGVIEVLGGSDEPVAPRASGGNGGCQMTGSGDRGAGWPLASVLLASLLARARRRRPVPRAAPGRPAGFS